MSQEKEIGITSPELLNLILSKMPRHLAGRLKNGLYRKSQGKRELRTLADILGEGVEAVFNRRGIGRKTFNSFMQQIICVGITWPEAICFVTCLDQQHHSPRSKVFRGQHAEKTT